MTPGQALHQQSEICSVSAGIDDQVNMIGHQAIAIDLQPEFASELLEGLQISQPIIVRDEYCATIVTSLNNVVRVVCDRDSGTSLEK